MKVVFVLGGGADGLTPGGWRFFSHHPNRPDGRGGAVHFYRDTWPGGSRITTWVHGERVHLVRV